MEKSRFLFVYGTLMAPFRHPMHRVMKRYARRMGKALMEGKLYDLGPYPGVVATPGSYVQGEVYEILDDARLFATLDRYEGDEYRREIVKIETEEGETLRAWVYLYRGAVSERRRIVSGDYAAFKGARKT